MAGEHLLQGIACCRRRKENSPWSAMLLFSNVASQPFYFPFSPEQFENHPWSFSNLPALKLWALKVKKKNCDCKSVILTPCKREKIIIICHQLFSLCKIPGFTLYACDQLYAKTSQGQEAESSRKSCKEGNGPPTSSILLQHTNNYIYLCPMSAPSPP